MKNRNVAFGALALFMLVLPGVSAATFTEDFEDDSVGNNPEATFYSYTETLDAGYITSTAPLIGGVQSMKLEGSGRGVFTLAAGAQLSDLDFSIKGLTITEDGVGSRQVIKIQSAAPTRTLVEFYLLCDDAANPGGCDLNVRFENVDSVGETLVDASVGDSQFDIEITPDWSAGTYSLFVDGVDDGVFPFLELPSNVGQLVFEKAPGTKIMNVVFDDWFVDGASDAVASQEGDIGQGLKNWATDTNFTTTGSLMLLGFVFLGIMFLAVAVPLVSLGLDNTVVPAVSFFAALTVLWLVAMGWWPDWVGIGLIILVAALISLVIRQLLMGMRDANGGAGIVAGSLGYFIICTSLLGFSGYATESIEVPTSSLETPDDVEAQTNMSISQQSFAGAVAECVITFFSDCSTKTESTTWATLTDVAGTIFNFARTAFTFLFQLLSFSLPIPVLFNAMIVLPPAAALATVGFGFITRSGSS